MLIVDQDLLEPNIRHRDNMGLAELVEHDTVLAIGAKDNLLSVMEINEHVSTTVFRYHCVECSVIEDVAVLVDLYKRCTLMGIGATEDLCHVLSVHVMGSSDE